MAQTVFDSPTAVGAKILTVTATVTNTSGAYTNTITDERITTAMKAIEIELGDPSVFGANITVTCNNGSITISCNDVVGTSTVSIDVIKTVDDPTSVTSIEFDVLNSRLNKVKAIINNVEEYDDESTYSAGDRVWYSGKLYKANQDIDIAEDWDNTHWDQEDIMDDIDDIRDSIPNIADNLTTNDATKTLSAKQGKVLNDSQAAVQDAIAIVATGDTHAAIESGQFVYVKGHSTLADGLYRASTAIAANESLTSSNLTADTDGGLNAVNDSISALNGKMTDVENKYIKNDVAWYANANLNNFTESGLYPIGQNPTNAPTGDNGYVTLVVETTRASIRQIYGKDNQLWVRENRNDVWTGWMLFSGTPLLQFMKSTGLSSGTVKFTNTENRYSALLFIVSNNASTQSAIYSILFKASAYKDVTKLAGEGSIVTVDDDGSINVALANWSNAVLLSTGKVT